MNGLWRTCVWKIPPTGHDKVKVALHLSLDFGPARRAPLVRNLGLDVVDRPKHAVRVANNPTGLLDGAKVGAGNTLQVREGIVLALLCLGNVAAALALAELGTHKRLNVVFDRVIRKECRLSQQMLVQD
jgi:hypothetical protein